MEPESPPLEKSMSATRAKKVKMATKSCPECDQQVGAGGRASGPEWRVRASGAPFLAAFGCGEAALLGSPRAGPWARRPRWEPEMSQGVAGETPRAASRPVPTWQWTDPQVSVLWPGRAGGGRESPTGSRLRPSLSGLAGFW